MVVGRKVRSEQKVVLPPLSMPARGLSADFVKLRHIFGIDIVLVVMAVGVRRRPASTLLLKPVNMLGTDTKSTHILVHLQSHLHLIILDTANYERLVEGEVALDPCALHHLLCHEGLLNVAILAVAFDHDAVCDEVRFTGLRRVRLEHLLEDLLRL